MTSFKTKFKNFVRTFPVEQFFTIAFGAGIGLLAANTVQDYLSHLAVEKCKVSTIYKLVEVDNPILGTYKRCISRIRFYGPTTPLKP
jgi:hypothetical protein